MTALQLAAVRGLFDTFSRGSRELGLTDQQVAEWLLRLSAKWLLAHGVSATSIHQWVQIALGQRVLVPLTAAARAKNDFGGLR